MEIYYNPDFLVPSANLGLTFGKTGSDGNIQTSLSCTTDN